MTAIPRRAAIADQPWDRGHRGGPRLHQPLGRPSTGEDQWPQTSDPATITVHHGAAAAIGNVASAWRSGDVGRAPHPTGRLPLAGGGTHIGHTTGQALKARRAPRHDGAVRSGSRPRPQDDDEGVPVHQITPTASGQTRRAADQDSLLVSNQERYAPDEPDDDTRVRAREDESTRCRAGWQYALRWLASLTSRGVVIAIFRTPILWAVEFLALAFAIGVSIFCLAKRRVFPPTAGTSGLHGSGWSTRNAAASGLFVADLDGFDHQ